MDELAADITYWGANGVGMFAVRENTILQGLVGIHDRPDGRGKALRFAVWHEARGRRLKIRDCCPQLSKAFAKAGNCGFIGQIKQVTLHRPIHLIGTSMKKELPPRQFWFQPGKLWENLSICRKT